MLQPQNSYILVTEIQEDTGLVIPGNEVEVGIVEEPFPYGPLRKGDKIYFLPTKLKVKDYKLVRYEDVYAIEVPGNGN